LVIVSFPVGGTQLFGHGTKGQKSWRATSLCTLLQPHQGEGGTAAAAAAVAAVGCAALFRHQQSLTRAVLSPV
jgi:hypothetical protein